MIEEDPTLVSVHLDQFKGLDSEVAQKLIEAGEVTYFSRNLASFEGLDKNIANELLDDAYPEDPTLFLVHIESFKELDKDILLKFLKKLPKRKDFRYDSDYVAYGNRIYNLIKNNIDKFEGVSLDKDLASKMIEAGLVTQVVENIDDFEGLDLNNIKIA